MPCFSLAVIKYLVLAFHIQIGECLNFNFPKFLEENHQDLILETNATIGPTGAVEVTYDADEHSMFNLSGRVCYHRKFKLWSKHKNVTASFNSSFVLNIRPRTPPTGSEGMAFLLAADCSNPDNSYGQWLGIVNASTNGSTTAKTNVVAVEFDTYKSYAEDIDGNHVGVDVNSIFSKPQVSLTDHSINISSGHSITASVRYDGVSKVLEIFVSATASPESMMKKVHIRPIISTHLDLSKHLPESVFVGFSASTGEWPENNCLKSWNFVSTDIDDEDPNFLLWAGILVPVIAVVLSIGVITCIYQKRKRRKEGEKDAEIEQEIQNSATGHPQKFKLKQLKLATQNFSPKNELGEGGFGRVYKGILKNKEVAVKRLISKHSGHGKQEFIAEVTTIGSLHHKNLVKLLGWCYESSELLLVYEFMPKGSLDNLIFGIESLPPLDGDKGSDSNSTILSWQTRHRIICGVAEALDYLHNGCEKRVLHRDIKASNIMLDSEFNPRLGDFGLARTFHLSEKTHHSTKEIAGTLGYMAPEIFHTRRASVETDVYAFGVLLLEVSCGRKPGKQDEHNDYINRIVEWVWELHGRKKISKAIDFRLCGDFAEEEAHCVLLLGLACCHPNPYQRPSMRTVLQVLNGEIAPPLVPLERPPFMWPAAAVISPSFEEHLDESVSGLLDIITAR